MTKLQNLLDKLSRDERAKEKLAVAKDAYSDKFFLQEYMKLHDLLEKTYFIPSLYSVGGAVLLFVCQLSNIYLAIASGLFFGVIIEASKHFISQKAFQAFFKRKNSTLLFIGAGSLYALSVGLSSWGAYEGFKVLESDKVGNEVGKHQSAIDSLNSSYATEISNKQKQLDDFALQYSIRHGRDKGRIDWSMRKQHTDLLAQLETLKEHHRQDVRQLEGQRAGIAQTASNSVAGYLYLCVGLSVVIELIIFFIARFLELYNYMSNKELELIDNGKTYTVSLNSLSAIASMMQATTIDADYQLQMKAPQLPEKKQVGFKVGNASANDSFKGALKHDSESTSESHESSFKGLESSLEVALKTRSMKDTDYRLKYPALIADLQALNSGSLSATTNELASKHNVSEGTIYRVKKALFV